MVSILNSKVFACANLFLWRFHNKLLKCGTNIERFLGFLKSMKNKDQRAWAFSQPYTRFSLQSLCITVTGFEILSG